ncbi:hypothetical protein GCM10011328_08470 [Hafnia psychrotolerans]|uniref:Uncharacterized protein n=1 Tax=Hafnia psychrotolerans TaxID=1477018 RepID=A0ABQ1G3M4_9GAMM|nr:hypothetical protein GCM10011328_08470 [Hafnia psychrotolerans]
MPIVSLSRQAIAILKQITNISVRPYIHPAIGDNANPYRQRFPLAVTSDKAIVYLNKAAMGWLF